MEGMVAATRVTTTVLVSRSNGLSASIEVGLPSHAPKIRGLGQEVSYWRQPDTFDMPLCESLWTLEVSVVEDC